MKTTLDEIDKFLFDLVRVLPGCCSSIDSVKYTIARTVAEALWPKKDLAPAFEFPFYVPDDDGFTIPDDNTGNGKTPANDDDGFTIPDDNTGNGNTPANDDNEFNFLKKEINLK